MPRLSGRRGTRALTGLIVRAMGPCCDYVRERNRECSQAHEQRFKLPAPADSTQAPLAEVFAVVADDVVSILAKPTARATNHVFPVEARIRVSAYGNGPATSKFRQRHLFYRSAVEASNDTRVMDDPPMTHIEAVMDVAASRRDEMRGQWRLFSRFQRPRIHEPSSGNLHHDYDLRSLCCAATCAAPISPVAARPLHDAYRRASP